MSRGITVVGQDSAGGVQLGRQFAPWTIGGAIIVGLGDAVAPHPPVPPHTSGPVMASGSSWFTINGTPVCRQGDIASCGHTTTGRAWFTIA